MKITKEIAEEVIGRLVESTQPWCAIRVGNSGILHEHEGKYQIILQHKTLGLDAVFYINVDDN